MSSSRVIVGIDAAIADAASLALMVENVGMVNNPLPPTPPYEYYCY